MYSNFVVTMSSLKKIQKTSMGNKPFCDNTIEAMVNCWYKYWGQISSVGYTINQSPAYNSTEQEALTEHKPLPRQLTL